MTEADAIRRDFLDRLDAELEAVPHGVARELREAIVEELDAAEPSSVAARIREFGDPAATARAAQGDAGDVPLAAVEKRAITASPRYAVVASLAIGCGGIVLPVLGWVIGAVMVVISPIWRLWEKAVTLVLPVLIVAVAVAVAQFGAPPPSEVNNPLLPATYDMVWFTLIVCAVVALPACGGWLLWRALRRPA